MNRFVWFMLGALIALSVTITLRLLDQKRRKLRLHTLTEYLETASYSTVTSLSRIDDEFSMLEDEIYKTIGELRIGREKAQQERHTQANNLADIAHQLKTPLTSMSLMTQLLSQNATTEQQEYIIRIENQLSRLDWLTSSLLTMSRLDAGTIDFAQKEISFESLVSQAIEPIEQTLKSKQQTIAIAGGDEILCCDAKWTSEALLNLIKNCSEHTPNGGEIRLGSHATPLYFQIDIEDSGSGFAPNELPKIFRRFYRGSNSSKDSIGVGLSLCKSIIEGQGGTIRAENKHEGGAHFIIRLYTKAYK